MGRFFYKKSILKHSAARGGLWALAFGSVLSAAAQAENTRNVLSGNATRLIGFETAQTYHQGTVELSIGTSQTNPNSGAGTGNQLYFGGGSYAPSDRFTFGFDAQTYQDPTLKPIGGVHPDIKMNTLALWGKYAIYHGGRMSISALASLESIVDLESPLFNGVSQGVMIGAFKAPMTFQASQRLAFHLTPSVSVFPGRVKGAEFYGTIVSIGAGVSYRPSHRLSFFGAVDAPVSGTNTISSTGSYKKVPVWTLGGRYNITPKGAIEAFLTNGVGATPATSILTHWPEGDDVLAGLRLIYTPGAKREESYRGVPNPVTSRQTGLQHDGFSMGSADVLEPGTVRVSAWGGSGNNAGVALSFSPDRDGEIQLILEQFSNNPTAASNLVPTTELRYMVGPKIRFMDQNNGNGFSLTGRMLFGRQIDDKAGVGVFFVEALGSYKANSRLVFTANPKVAAFGDTEIAGVGLGVNYELVDGLEFIAEVTPVAMDGRDATWAAGLRYDIAGSGVTVDMQATNAIGRYGIGGMVAQDDVRFALTLSKSFDLTGNKFY